ncbi:glycosyltransferase [Hydrogenophaga sp. 5NK40-0174]|uniref:glycosyltransferase family 2 protein n=1 Tax=Hydrogenophaga sp. 5NK40-0174 TaxID=3127649 RepID=UPI00310C57E2
MNDTMRNTLSASVIIPTYKRLDMLQRCLPGVAAMDTTPREVLITYRPEADPETTAWLLDEAPKHSDWVLVPSHEPGQVAALNLALRRASGDIVVIFDDDAIPRRDWLSKVLSHFQSDPGVGGVGGRDFVHEHGGTTLSPERKVAGIRNRWGQYLGNHHLVVGAPREVDVLKGCNWAVRRTALGSLHSDTRLLGSGAQFANDSWFCINLRQHGWKLVLDPSANVDHYPAEKPDHARHGWNRLKCHEMTTNKVFSELYFATSWERTKYLAYFVLKGTRYCPGLYFLAHGLLKRPLQLPAIAWGGWTGYVKGWRMCHRYEPPGQPATPGSLSHSAA